MAMKYCEQHDIWYDYKEGCPECGKFGRVAGSIIGNIIGGGIWATVTAARKVKEYNKRQKEIEATRISAKINEVWQEHNIIFNGVSGMNIHIKFEVNNMLNLTGSCNVYFYDKKKKPLKDTNQNYYTVDGQVSVWNKYTPNYQNCLYNDFVLFIPYSELHLSIGYYNLKFQIEIFDCNTTSIAKSNFFDFNVNWQGEQGIASIREIWQEHNAIINGVPGMNIHIKFHVNEELRLTGSCNAYFYDSNNNPLRDTNNNYHSVNGQVSVGQPFTFYPNYTYNDFNLFIPYSEFHLPIGYHNLKFQIEIFDCNTTSIAKSNFFDFNVNWQGEQRVETISRRNLKQTNYPDIKSIIQKVINYAPDGSAIISIGDLYMQFYAYNEKTLVVEAVSNFYVTRIGNKDKEFKIMGFTIDRTTNGNYIKEYSTRDLTRIIKDIVQVFENVYKIKFIDYTIDDNC